MRIPTNDYPSRWVLDDEAASHLGLDVNVLITQTEFGMSLAWRENARDTWSAPIALLEVER